MSKSYGNVIGIFADEKTLKNQVMGIVTDSTPLESPKDPLRENVFRIYSYFATDEEKKSLAEQYRKGGFGYGEAKKLLLAKILELFELHRRKRKELSGDIDYIWSVLKKGAEKAGKTASETMREVREKVGLNL